MSRDDAYRVVQAAQRAWDERVDLRDVLAERSLGLGLDAVLDLSVYTRHAHEIVSGLGPVHK